MQIKQSVQEFTKTIDGAKDELKNCDEGVYFLVNPAGEFVKAFGHEQTSQEIGAAVSVLYDTQMHLLWEHCSFTQSLPCKAILPALHYQHAPTCYLSLALSFVDARYMHCA